MLEKAKSFELVVELKYIKTSKDGLKKGGADYLILYITYTYIKEYIPKSKPTFIKFEEI